MATQPATDANQTEALNVVENLDLGLTNDIQTLLAPLYASKYGAFLTTQVLGIPLGQIMAAVLVFGLFLLLRRVFTSIIVVFLQRLAQKTKTNYDQKIISALKGPIGFGFIIIGLHLFFKLVFLDTEFIKNVLGTLVIYTIFWGILAVINASREIVYAATEKINKDLSREMGNFLLAIVKVLVFALGLGAILEVWGINVTALVASLGIGGLAFALAAKDTAANLFGSFSVLADKSVRIGDWVKVGGVEGVVEDVGMRTTKIRSFQKSLYTVPNQMIANSPIENFSRRGIRRIKMNIGLTYDTSSAQIAAIVTAIRTLLENHEGISQDSTLLVSFESFGDSSLNVLVYCFTDTANWKRYLEIREEVSMAIMKIVEDNGSAFAFPSQSLYVESLPEGTVVGK